MRGWGYRQTWAKLKQWYEHRGSFGPTGSNGVKEASEDIRGLLLVEEENQVKLRGVRGDNGGVLPLRPHGEVPLYSPFTYQSGRCWGKCFGDQHGVLSVDPEVSGIPGGRMFVKGENPRETTGAIHLLTLEYEGGNCT